MIKNKITCYLDSSVQLALVDDPGKNPQKEIMKDKTDDLWELFLENKEQYLIIISDTGLKEVEDVLTGRHPENELQEKIEEQQQKQNIINYDTVITNNDILSLAQEYMIKDVFLKEQDKDALHVATATVKGFDYLLSWNFRQMAHVNKLKDINKVNVENGYNEILIISPETYLTEYSVTQNKMLQKDNQYKIDSTKDHKINDKISFEYILYEPDRTNKNNKNKLKYKDRVILSGKIIDILTLKPKLQNTYIVELQNYISTTNNTTTTLPYTSLPQEMKDLLPKTILITESRLDRYRVFREPRENEKKQARICMLLKRYAQFSKFLLGGKPAKILSCLSAGISKIPSGESEKDTSKIITGSIPKTTFEEKSSELLKTKNKPPGFKPPS